MAGEHASGEQASNDQLQGLIYANVSDVIFSVVVERGRFRFSTTNPAFTRATGLTSDQVIGRYVDEVIPEPSLGLVLKKYGQAIRERRTLCWDEMTTYPTGRRYGEVSVTPVFSSDGQCLRLVGTVHDVTEAREQHALTLTEQRVLECVASGAPLARTLETLVLGIEELAPSAIASVLLLAGDEKSLLYGAAPHLPRAYSQAIDGAAIGPMAGSCGAAASMKQTVIATDVQTDPRWADYRSLARRFDLHACWSTPIMDSHGRVLGTFALYYREPRSPSENELKLIARATHVARIAIQRNELDEQLHALSARIETVREEERTAIAREMQGPMGQMLSTLKESLTRLSEELLKLEPLAVHPLAPRLQELLALSGTLAAHVNRLSAELRPSVLDDVGLIAALAWQAEEFEKRTRTFCLFRSDVLARHIDPSVSTTAFRIFQEALSNVVLFAEAHRVDASLKEEGATLVLEVKDDGKGIRPEVVQDPRSVGLAGMRERAGRIGGNISFERVHPHGTLVRLRLPLAAH